MQGIVIAELWKLPLRFQRKACKARLCAAGSDSLRASPKKMMCEAVREKLRMPVEAPGCWEASRVECQLRKTAGNNGASPREKPYEV
jgi:hypothetical protein